MSESDSTRAILSTGDDAGLVERLWLATKHGDEEHQAWLRDAYAAFFAGQPVPEPRGQGRKEAAILSLTARNKALEEALREIIARGPERLGMTAREIASAALNHQDNRQKEGGE
jgi:hypothetical protein